MNKNQKAVFLTILAAILWGTSFPAIKIGLQYIDATLFVFLRFLIALIITLTVLILTKKFRFELKGNKKLIFFIGISNGIAYLLQYFGMNYTSAAKSSLFINLTAIWVALLSTFLIKERFSKRKTFAVISGVLGVLLVTTNLNISLINVQQLFGDIVVILAGIVWAFFIIYNKILMQREGDTFQVIVWILAVTLLPMVPFVLFSINNLFQIPLEGWLAIIYTAVMCWVIPYYLWLEGLKHISASNSTILLLTEILVATTIGVLILNEIITIVMGIGISLIVIALFLTSNASDVEIGH
ncbi:DMT family transporter [Candidatus Bathyarchaeota archaeon]|nr:DMT family transporter [Candidatus Bathyarchaeota archaeon]